MKNKTYRLATALAILLALALVFVAPVGAAGYLQNAEGAAAKIDDQYYSTLEYAVNNITTTPGTIVVQNDVVLTAQLIIHAGKTIILDLNGHTISMTDCSSTGCYMIKNSGDLTITDGSTEKTGKLSFRSTTPDSSYGYSTSTVGNAGKLTVESGIIESNTNGGASYAIDNFWYKNDVETIINGGTITSKGIAIRQVPFSTTYKNTLTITDGTISADTGAVQTHCYSDACLADVIITGGTLTGTYAYYTSYSDTNYHSATSIEISGGTFNGYLYIFNENACSSSHNFKNVKITDGTFNSGAWVYTKDANNDYFSIKSITGGLFPTGVDASYIKDGYHCIGNEDDGYEVTPDVTVTASPIEGGTVSFSYETTAEGTEITLTANPNNGYKFDMWNVISGGVTITNDKFTMPEDAVSIEAVFVEGETETPPAGEPAEPVEPSFDDSGFNVEETDGKVTVTFDSPVLVSADDSGDLYVEITHEESGVIMQIYVSGESVDEGGDINSATIDSVSVIYGGEESPINDDVTEITDVKYVLDIEVTTPDTPLPKINPAFKDEVADKITAVYDDHKPLAMITAESNIAEIKENLTAATEEQKPIMAIFLIEKSEYEALIGTIVGYHVYYDETERKDVVDLVDVSSVIYDEMIDGKEYYMIILQGEHFSTYAVGIAPASEGGDVGTEDDSGSVSPGDSGSGSSGKDTGSGNFQYYPRSVPTDGIIDFGTSKVVTGMELPAGSDGTVTLNIKPTFAMPENGFYAFEIDAPGYNLDAKINGGLSFQIPVADLEAAGWTAEDIVLFHGTVGEDGKIVWEALPTNLVKNENGVAYYKAAINGCSPFYIGFVKDGSVVNTEVVDPVTPETEEPDVPGEDLPDIPGVQDEPEEPSSPAPILAVLAGLGAAVVLRRK